MSSGQKKAYEDAMEEAEQGEVKAFNANKDKHRQLAKDCLVAFEYLDIDTLRLTHREWTRLNSIRQNIRRIFGYE